MICHDSECIFVHIPKNAGQSIETVFLEHNGLTWDTRAPLLLRKNDNPKLGPERLGHLLAADYTKYKYISEKLFNQYFKFAVVRNPYSRLVSFYKYLGYSNFCSFSFFILNLLDDLYVRRSWFLRPQADYVYNNGEILVDKLIKLEELEVDFDLVRKKVGINERLKHVNKSNPKPKKSKLIKFFKILRDPRLILDKAGELDKNPVNWNPLVIKKINEIYALDFEVLDYDKIHVDVII
ncbi:hypothetical protein CXF72_06350 [Psychromonas sp. MB-3u-54]|uniref:sulfotransferase family 2 domain-containing protein n=1 Tax=Psychromonas sp. MB-3u-54 TaxID=2058319 RepID=UPI000C34F071|nr:sulfotransferase family 2 domain-containing protein [Psychromonas sp. MB-3u-54]PKH03427.1 hypothetical protein CXF72_06350 [Psychromonas sp. MB-3u-54]